MKIHHVLKPHKQQIYTDVVRQKQYKWQQREEKRQAGYGSFLQDYNLQSCDKAQ